MWPVLVLPVLSVQLVWWKQQNQCVCDHHQQSEQRVALALRFCCQLSQRPSSQYEHDRPLSVMTVWNRMW